MVRCRFKSDAGSVRVAGPAVRVPVLRVTLATGRKRGQSPISSTTTRTAGDCAGNWNPTPFPPRDHCPPGANGPSARAPEPPTQRGAVGGKHVALFRGAAKSWRLRASWIPACAGMTTWASALPHTAPFVIPAKAGIQGFPAGRESGRTGSRRPQLVIATSSCCGDRNDS